MIINKKRGITLTSLVIYIVLFTSFTIFVTNISSNMTERLFNDRGEAINYSNLNKLQYNIDYSAMNSNDVTLDDGNITYSNGDVYKYNSESKVILKNGGILCLNVDEFNVNLEEGTNAKKLTIQIKFNKYLNIMSRSIISCVEVI